MSHQLVGQSCSAQDPFLQVSGAISVPNNIQIHDLALARPEGSDTTYRSWCRPARAGGRIGGVVAQLLGRGLPSAGPSDTSCRARCRRPELVPGRSLPPDFPAAYPERGARPLRPRCRADTCRNTTPSARPSGSPAILSNNGHHDPSPHPFLSRRGPAQLERTPRIPRRLRSRPRRVPAHLRPLPRPARRRDDQDQVGRREPEDLRRHRAQGRARRSADPGQGYPRQRRGAATLARRSGPRINDRRTLPRRRGSPQSRSGSHRSSTSTSAALTKAATSRTTRVSSSSTSSAASRKRPSTCSSNKTARTTPRPSASRSESPGTTYEPGEGASKKQAEQTAALIALQALEIVERHDDGSVKFI